ncbi:MAG TPA: threonine/serine dehydratase [Bacillota bacterium]
MTEQPRTVSPETELVNLDRIAAARRRIAPHLVPTPLAASTTFSRLAGFSVWLKPENLQRTGSFKVRGALSAVLAACAAAGDRRPRGFVTASSGNHGQALAYAAGRVGLPAVVVVPEQASPLKVQAALGYGAEVIHHGRFSDERKARARQLAEERGYLYVDPTDDPDVIAGQGTIGLEILEELPDLTAVVAPIGGGGLISGVAAAVKALRPVARVIGVEPNGAASMYASLEAGRPVTLAETASVADGLLTRRPGEVPFAHVRRFVDAIVRVDDDEILDAMALVAERAKLVVEPSGAASLAAGLAGRLDGLIPRGDGAKVVFILSGGNVARDRFAAWVGAPLRKWEGLDLGGPMASSQA